MLLSQVSQHLNARHYGQDFSFDSVNTDTRKIKRGDLFIALKGDNFDANLFLLEAQERGACAVIAEQENDAITIPQIIVEDGLIALGQVAKLKRETLLGKVIGVTGSSGKTTVKGMLASICMNAGEASHTQGNLNNKIGVPLTLCEASKNSDYVIVEAGMNSPGEIEYLTDIIQPDVALVNNVGAAHLGFFNSVRDIAEEKFAIYGKHNATAVVNLDDAYAELFIAKLSGRKLFGFSEKTTVPEYLDNESGISIVHASNITCDDFGCYRFELGMNDLSAPIELSTIGKHNVNNALAAATCALAANINLEDIAAGLKEFSGAPGRMQIRIKSQHRLLVDDTYNANPESMKAAIDWLSQFENTLLVVGDMAELGKLSESKHKEVGKYAKEHGISNVCAFGQFANHFIQGFGKGGNAFDGKDRLFEYLKGNEHLYQVILFKGSRSAKMETLLNQLLESEA